MNSKISVLVCFVSLAVVSVVSYKTRNTAQNARIEACQIVMRDLYEDMGLKAIDENSLDKFCKDKFNK